MKAFKIFMRHKGTGNLCLAVECKYGVSVVHEIIDAGYVLTPEDLENLHFVEEIAPEGSFVVVAVSGLSEGIHVMSSYDSLVREYVKFAGFTDFARHPGSKKFEDSVKKRLNPISRIVQGAGQILCSLGWHRGGDSIIYSRAAVGDFCVRCGTPLSITAHMQLDYEKQFLAEREIEKFHSVKIKNTSKQ